MRSRNLGVGWFCLVSAVCNIVLLTTLAYMHFGGGKRPRQLTVVQLTPAQSLTPAPHAGSNEAVPMHNPESGASQPATNSSAISAQLGASLPASGIGRYITNMEHADVWKWIDDAVKEFKEKKISMTKVGQN